MRPPHAGHPAASSVHQAPVPTHTTRRSPGPSRAPDAAHTTSGSSALATTARVGRRVSAVRHASAIPRTSWVRSSWSRLRFSNVTTAGPTWASTWGSHSSSHSSAASRASGAAPSATTMPASMLAPSALVATGPRVARAAARKWLVVLLPLVPLTSTTLRPSHSCWSSRRWTNTATCPPMTLPEPSPVRRDSHDTAAAVARVARASARRRGGGASGRAGWSPGGGLLTRRWPPPGAGVRPSPSRGCAAAPWLQDARPWGRHPGRGATTAVGVSSRAAARWPPR